MSVTLNHRTSSTRTDSSSVSIAPRATEEIVKRAMARIEAFQNLDIGNGPNVVVAGLRLDRDGAVRVRPADDLDIKAPLDLAHAMLVAEGVTNPVVKLEDIQIPEALSQQTKTPMARADRIALAMLGIDEPITKAPVPAERTSPLSMLMREKSGK